MIVNREKTSSMFDNFFLKKCFLFFLYNLFYFNSFAMEEYKFYQISAFDYKKLEILNSVVQDYTQELMKTSKSEIYYIVKDINNYNIQISETIDKTILKIEIYLNEEMSNKIFDLNWVGGFSITYLVEIENKKIIKKIKSQ